MNKANFIVIISANIEWHAIHTLLTDIQPQNSPLGEWFVVNLAIAGRSEPVIFFHGGWGKIAAAASTQYVIDRWSPSLLVNLGTCGGFEGEIRPGTIILAERTLIYDIVEQMGDYDEHIAHYTTEVDLSWLCQDYPQPVQRTLLVSADRDLLAEDIPRLKAEFGAVAGDWESGAIAWVAARNGTRCLILRGVSDLVGSSGGEAYAGNIHVFIEGAKDILRRLVEALPAWLARVDTIHQEKRSHDS
jgi:adenosylhomocysteine nucleosidase